MVKKHIILRKRTAPIQVNLPNDRSFTSKWERISRKQLPINIKASRNRTIGPRRNNRRIYFNESKPALKKIRKKRRQEKKRLARVNQLYPDMSPEIRSGIGKNLLKAGINLGSKAIGSEIGKKIINKGIDNMPSIFKFGRSKIKNKNIKKALESEIAEMVVGEVKSKARKKYDSTNLLT